MQLTKLKTGGFAVTRVRLGLSQRQLAEQLGISKTTIAMAETGRRNLPVAALIRLTELEIKMAAVLAPGIITAVKETKMEQRVQYSHKSMEIRELQCELQIQNLSNTLETMTAQYKKFHTQLQLVDGILEKESREPGNNFALSMQLHRERILRLLAKCSPTTQQLLRNRIAQLGAETLLNRNVRQQIKSI